MQQNTLECFVTEKFFRLFIIYASKPGANPRVVGALAVAFVMKHLSFVINSKSRMFFDINFDNDKHTSYDVMKLITGVKKVLAQSLMSYSKTLD